MISNSKSLNFWVSFMGSSPLASLNCIWLAYERDGFLPDKVIYFVTPLAKRKVEQYLAAFKEFFARVKGKRNVALEQLIEIIEISEPSSLDTLTELVAHKVEECKKRGFVAVDITPGRKIMSIAALEGASRANADKIYYLYLLDESYRNMFAQEIPCVIQTLYVIECDKNAIH